MGKTQNEADRKQMLAEAKRICDSYAHNKEEVDQICVEMKRLDDLKKNCAHMSSRELIDRQRSDLEAKSIKKLEEIMLFNSTVSKCDGKTASIMRQLYADQISWDFVKDKKGRTVGRGTIFRARRKAMNLMADEIQKKNGLRN